jgi:hypothetical protein
VFSAAGGGGGGPCLFEPQDGALFPNNWLRPRFRMVAPANQSMYEIRVTAPNQANPLVVYTNNIVNGYVVWTMPKDIWVNLAAHSRDMTIGVTVRSANSSGTVLMGSSTSFTIAPAAASGKMVYWSTSGSTNGTPTGSETFLSGFAVGDESVVQVLTPAQVAGYSVPGMSPWLTYKQGDSETRPVSCIGCHTSTPDGAFISFNDFYPWGAVIVSGATGMQGAPPSFALAGGRGAAAQPWVGITTYSKLHWTSGDHIMVAPLGTNPANDGSADTDQRSGLAWFDLESPVTGMAAQPGATGGTKGVAWDWIYPGASGQYAAAPAWAHTTDTILFTMTNKVVSGRLGSGTAHLATVPYAKSGAPAPTPLPGDGSDTNFAQYYASYTGDDKLIAFNSVPAGVAAVPHAQMDGSSTPWDGMYAQPAAEIFVMGGTGGPKTRLKANDPATCEGQPKSGTINNSWPKWSPGVAVSGARTYYWLIFSSWREGARYPNGSPIAQLYVTAVVIDEISTYTYPAIYLWNQPANYSNHTPAWDVFQIPDVQ